MDTELEKVRLKIYLRHLLPIKQDAKSLDLSSIDFTKDCFIASTRDLYRECFVIGLLSLKKKYSYKLMNAYRLLDIMLEHDLEYKSFAHISEYILMLTVGYSEMENKRQADVINQVIDIRRMQGKITWIFLKGSQLKANDLGLIIKPVFLENKSKIGGRLI